MKIFKDRSHVLAALVLTSVLFVSSASGQVEQTKPTAPSQPGKAPAPAPAEPGKPPAQPEPAPVPTIDQSKPVHLRYQAGAAMVAPTETYWSSGKWCRINYDEAGKFHDQSYFDGKCLWQFTVGQSTPAKDCGKDAADKSKPQNYFPFLNSDKTLGEPTGKPGRILGMDCEIYKQKTGADKSKETCWSKLEGLVLQSTDLCSGKPCGMTLLNRANNLTGAELQKKCTEKTVVDKSGQ
jgi:hypothetical protein